jgi:hypothetical protein
MSFGQLLTFDIWLGRAYCCGTFSLRYKSLVLFWSNCTNWFRCIATNILNMVCQLACCNHRRCTFFKFQVLILVPWWYFSGIRCRLISWIDMDVLGRCAACIFTPVPWRGRDKFFWNVSTVLLNYTLLHLEDPTLHCVFVVVRLTVMVIQIREV